MGLISGRLPLCHGVSRVSGRYASLPAEICGSSSSSSSRPRGRRSVIQRGQMLITAQSGSLSTWRISAGAVSVNPPHGHQRMAQSNKAFRPSQPLTLGPLRIYMAHKRMAGL